MERDFMGLSTKEPLASVKREITDEGPPTTLWHFTKNAASHSHFMSFKARAIQDDRMKIMTSDAITSSTFIPSSTPDAFDHGLKASVGESQYFPIALSNPLLKPNFTSYGQNLTGSTMTQQFHGIPMTVTSPVGQVVAFTDPWNNNKSLARPAQMTIFYAGTVSVYNEISLDKAEAIMVLAGNGSSLASNMIPARPQVPLPVTKVSPTVANAVVSNQHLSSSNVTVSKDEQVVNRTSGVSSAPIIKPEPQRVVASRGPVHVPVLTSSAVPQFRKASLARFLEKRKERVMSVGPYNCDKKPQEGINNNLTSVANFSTSASTAIRGS